MLNNIIIFIILIIIIISIINFTKFKNEQEDFNLNNLTLHNGIDKSESYIYNILPKYNDEDGFIGTYISSDITSNVNELKNNLIQTYSLQNNKWITEPISNGGIFYKNNNYVIIDLTWSQDILNELNEPIKKLIAVGMMFNKDTKNYDYKIFIKKTEKIDSLWEPLFPNSDIDKQIICIRYDLHNNLIGINKEDYQIYKFKFKSKLNLDPSFHGIWKGPLNFDSSVKLSKIMFDIDKHLLGIDTDGNLHKKVSMNWEESSWKKTDSRHSTLSTNISNSKNILDMVHDLDGKLIATTKYGLVKQTINSWDSDFIDYDEKNNNITVTIDKNILSKNSVLMFRTGNDSKKYDFLRDDDEYTVSDYQNNYSRKIVLDKLNYYLNLKRKLREVCKSNKTNLYKVTPLKSDVLFDSFDANSNEVSSIKNIINGLTKKGYNF